MEDKLETGKSSPVSLVVFQVRFWTLHNCRQGQLDRSNSQRLASYQNIRELRRNMLKTQEAHSK